MKQVDRNKVKMAIELPGARIHAEVEAHFVWAVVGSTLLALFMGFVGFRH
jgi:hypothetical protein